MRQTTLSRKSFYVYFEDRYELLTALFKPLRAELDQANAIWTEGSGDPVGEGRESLMRVAEVIVRDGVLIRALHEASRHDPRARRVWRGFHEPVIAAFAEQTRREVQAGRLPPVDVEPTVRALVGMNLYCFFDQIVGNPTVDTEAIAETLFTIWARTFLLSDPQPEAGGG